MCIEEPHFDDNHPKFEKVTYPDGAVYIGEWYQSRQHGFGKFTWDEGASYIGFWKNGMFEG